MGADESGITCTIKNGLVRGEKTDGGLVRYLGIPYAKAPVGALRFRTAQPCDDWEGVRDCLEKSKDPVQGTDSTRWSDFSEDCLYLNVYKPDCGNEVLPVLAFVYGGSYDSGGTSGYSFEHLSRETRAIVVSMNYRVSALGFLNFSDLSPEFDDNLGLGDVLLALRWIHDNISSFGGDPANVTLWGQSAGAGIVSAMMLNPLARECFQKAFIMSNCWESFCTPDEGRQLRDQYLSALGLTAENVESLKTMDISSLMKGVSGITGLGELGTTQFQPVFDGGIFSLPPLWADYQDISMPVMVGTTNDEARLFTRFIPGKAVKEMMKDDTTILQNVDKSVQLQLFSSYKGFPSKKAAGKILTDLMYKVPSTRWADNYSAGAPVYFYRYDAYPLLSGVLGLKSCHACDLLMLVSDKPGKAARNFLQYIAGFLHDGEPSAQGLPQWLPYTENERNVLIINSKCEPAKNIYSREMDRYDGINPLLKKSFR